MPLFKYIVANKEGKKLSGTVESPDEITAKNELNNLGFSILSLKETLEHPNLNVRFKKYVFEAVDKNTKLVSGTIPAKNIEEAFTKLQIEYNLFVSAIWEEGATQEQIDQAKKQGTQALQAKINPQYKKELKNSLEKNLEDQKKEQFIRAKIENTLKEVNDLLQKFDKELDPNQKTEINGKIDKLLRIKHSTNLDYILETAKELLQFMQEQAQSLKEKGYEEKQFELKYETKKLLDDLNREARKKTFSEDITGRIEAWQVKQTASAQKQSFLNKFLNKIFEKIKKLFFTPPEILAQKDKIKTYTKQLWELLQLYFKEPTPEYKSKVKESIKTVWKTRKKAKIELREMKKNLKKSSKITKIDENLFISFIEELNSFTGWVLGFYIAYYFISIYINTKDFGLSNIPKGFLVYESQIFKYVLVIVFLLHAAATLKINFFKKSAIANFVLPPIFIFGTILTLLNF